MRHPECVLCRLLAAILQTLGGSPPKQWARRYAFCAPLQVGETSAPRRTTQISPFELHLYHGQCSEQRAVALAPQPARASHDAAAPGPAVHVKQLSSMPRLGTRACPLGGFARH